MGKNAKIDFLEEKLGQSVVFIKFESIKETKIPSGAKSLKLVRLKPRHSVTSSNKQKCKWISSLWNILNCRKSVTF